MAQKVLGLAAAAYDWSVDVETAVSCSAFCTRQQLLHCSVKVTVQYEDEWIIMCWFGVFCEVLHPIDEELFFFLLRGLEL